MFHKNCQRTYYSSLTLFPTSEYAALYLQFTHCRLYRQMSYRIIILPVTGKKSGSPSADGWYCYRYYRQALYEHLKKSIGYTILSIVFLLFVYKNYTHRRVILHRKKCVNNLILCVIFCTVNCHENFVPRFSCSCFQLPLLPYCFRAAGNTASALVSGDSHR